jgi:hypothetical protein
MCYCDYLKHNKNDEELKYEIKKGEAKQTSK